MWSVVLWLTFRTHGDDRSHPNTSQECCKSEAERIVPFVKEDLVSVVACTNLTQNEICMLWKRFTGLREKDGEMGETKAAFEWERTQRQQALKDNFTKRYIDPGRERAGSKVAFTEEERKQIALIGKEDEQKEKLELRDIKCVGVVWCPNRVYSLGEVAKFEVDANPACPESLGPLTFSTQLSRYRTPRVGYTGSPTSPS